METKKCSYCKKILPVDMFAIDRQKKSGLTSRCKDCIKLTTNKEREKEYRLTHKEEAKKRWQKFKSTHQDYLKQKYKQNFLKECNYCKADENELVENYTLAQKDNFLGWHRHHRLETHNSDGEIRIVPLTHKELDALGMYYERPAKELIWMRISEHMSLHNKFRSYYANHKEMFN